jgi:hypothetical protein
MRKFNRHSRRALRFRSLLLVAGALMLMAAFVPKADAVLVTYWNLEDEPPPGSAADPSLSVFPGQVIGAVATFSQTGGFTPEVTTGIAANVATGDLTPNLHGVGFFTTPTSTGVITLTNVTGGSTGYAGFSLSFAVNTNGNGYHNIQLAYQVNGGGFINFGAPVVIGNGTSVVVIDLTGLAAINNQGSVDLRVTFSGGNSNGQNLQTQIDNIQLNALIPEPTTVAGGLFGVLGLCWHQRRRLRLILPRSRRA